MTIRHQIELESIFLLTAVAAVSLFMVVQRNNYQPQFTLASGLPSISAQAEVIVPKITIFSQISPDGLKKVIMKVTENNDNTKTYNITTADENGTNEQFVFTKTLDMSGSMTIPFNTWSPDDKYFFIQEDMETNKSILVFKASGEPFSETEKYFDATDILLKRETGDQFAIATGWASESLIIINTTKPDGSRGSSYWFEVPSKAIFQLSTDF